MNNPDTPAGSNKPGPTPPRGRGEADPATHQMPAVREERGELERSSSGGSADAGRDPSRPSSSGGTTSGAGTSGGREANPAGGASNRPAYGSRSGRGGQPASGRTPSEPWTPDNSSSSRRDSGDPRSPRVGAPAAPVSERPPAAPSAGAAAGGGLMTRSGTPPKPPAPAPSGRRAEQRAASAEQQTRAIPAAATATMAPVSPTFPDEEPEGSAPPRGRARFRPPAGRIAAALSGPPPSANARRARLRVARLDPWTVMKVTFLLSIALGIVTLVAVTVLWLTLNVVGVFGQLGDTVKSVTGTGADNGGGFDLQGFLSLPNVLGFTTVVAIVDVVLVTALATLAAYLYNLSAGFAGGIEVTLAEEDG